LVIVQSVLCSFSRGHCIVCKATKG
jgi:hypothetical protein